MEISGNSINQPVNFYPKNTGNTINMAIESENHLYTENVFASEISFKKASKSAAAPSKKRKKNKRLNTIDTDYLPDEAQPSAVQNGSENFFIAEEQHKISKNIKKAFEHFFTSTPLFNYFFLKQKQMKIKQTVETLNDISQNVDELLNTSVPFGEEETVYRDIAQNLTTAAGILGKANKNI